MFRTGVVELSLQRLCDVRVQAEVERARVIEHPQQCLHERTVEQSHYYSMVSYPWSLRLIAILKSEETTQGQGLVTEPHANMSLLIVLLYTQNSLDCKQGDYISDNFLLVLLFVTVETRIQW